MVANKVDEASADTQKEFGGGKTVGAVTAPCFAKKAVKVKIVTMQPVACPGHKFDIRAVGDPLGGTYKWTVSGVGASLVDIAGNPTNAGTRVFLLSFRPNNKKGKIPSRRARVSVTYTHPNGTAQATKRIKIHAINFSIRKTKVKRGWTQATENFGGVNLTNSPGKASMATDPQIQILVGNACPRKVDCARNHRVGWLQTVRTNDRRARYRHTRLNVTVPLPIRDAMPPYPPIPFYGPPTQFTGDKNKQTAHHEDSPGQAATWLDPRVPSPANPIPVGQRQLRRMWFTNSFTGWLVVQNLEWSAHDLNHSFVFLKHFDWRVRLNVQVKMANPVANRVHPRRRRPTIGAVQNGKGPRNPVLTAPIANTSAVVNINAAPAIP